MGYYQLHDWENIICTKYFPKLKASITFINSYALLMLLVHHNQPTPHGALELVWNILDFQKEQDVRLKVGYELVDKVYFY